MTNTNYSDKPVGWIMLTHRCTREQAEVMLPPWSGPVRLVLPPIIDRHEVNNYEWSAIASKVESIRRADQDEKVLLDRLARRRGAHDGNKADMRTIDELGIYKVERTVIVGNFETDYTDEQRKAVLQRAINGLNKDSDPATLPPFDYRNTPNLDKLSEASFRLELAQHELRRKINSTPPPQIGDNPIQRLTDKQLRLNQKR